MMTAGDLTPSMIGRARIRTKFQEAEIEGRLNSITLECEPVRMNSKQGITVMDKVEVHMAITVGQIEMHEVPLNHEVRIVS